MAEINDILNLKIEQYFKSPTVFWKSGNILWVFWDIAALRKIRHCPSKTWYISTSGIITCTKYVITHCCRGAARNFSRVVEFFLYGMEKFTKGVWDFFSKNPSKLKKFSRWGGLATPLATPLYRYHTHLYTKIATTSPQNSQTHH